MMLTVFICTVVLSLLVTSILHLYTKYQWFSSLIAGRGKRKRSYALISVVLPNSLQTEH